MISPMLIPILGISCGLVAIIGGVFFRPLFKLWERRMEIEAGLAAEKPPNMPLKPNGSNSGCKCSNGSSPIAA